MWFEWLKGLGFNVGATKTCHCYIVKLLKQQHLGLVAMRWLSGLRHHLFSRSKKEVAVGGLNPVTAKICHLIITLRILTSLWDNQTVASGNAANTSNESCLIKQEHHAQKWSEVWTLEHFYFNNIMTLPTELCVFVFVNISVYAILTTFIVWILYRLVYRSIH